MPPPPEPDEPLDPADQAVENEANALELDEQRRQWYRLRTERLRVLAVLLRSFLWSPGEQFRSSDLELSHRVLETTVEALCREVQAHARWGRDRHTQDLQ